MEPDAGSDNSTDTGVEKKTNTTTTVKTNSTSTKTPTNSTSKEIPMDANTTAPVAANRTRAAVAKLKQGQANLMSEGTEIVADLKGARNTCASGEAAMVSQSSQLNSKADTDSRHFDYQWLKDHPSFLKEQKALGVDKDARHF